MGDSSPRRKGVTVILMALSMHFWKQSLRKRYEQSVLVCRMSDTETLAEYTLRFCANAEGLGWSTSEMFRILRDNARSAAKTVLMTITGAEFMSTFELQATIDDMGTVEGDLPQTAKMSRVQFTDQDTTTVPQPTMKPHPNPSQTGSQDPPPYKRRDQRAPTKDEVSKDPSKRWCDACESSTHNFLDCHMITDNEKFLDVENQGKIAKGMVYYQTMRTVRNQAYAKIRESRAANGGKGQEGGYKPQRPPAKKDHQTN
jgi:hypothetical protein